MGYSAKVTLERFLSAAFLPCLLFAAENSGKPVLQLSGSIEMPGVSGDLDHSAIDTEGQRLFLAAEDNATLKIFDLKSGKLSRTVTGFETPHSILYLPAANEIYLADGSRNVHVLDSRTFAVKKNIATTPGADSMGVDGAHDRLFVVSGGKDVKMTTSAISEIDTRSGKLVREIPIDAAHVEAMAVEKSGSRLFVNVTDKNYIAVIDRSSGKIVAKWPVHEAKQNAPMAFDEAAHRLFVVCRDPGKLVVVDSANGKTIASFATGMRADEVVFDTIHHRIYVLAGEGKIYPYHETDADHFEALAPVPSAVGAKTGVLTPDASHFYVAVSPGEGKTGAKLLGYKVE